MKFHKKLQISSPNQLFDTFHMSISEMDVQYAEIPNFVDVGVADIFTLT